jgi:hypothetical protein
VREEALIKERKITAPMASQNNDPNKEIAHALVAIAETQDAIIRMLWSIRQGIPSSGSLDDSDFKNLDARRKITVNALKTKYGIY